MGGALSLLGLITRCVASVLELLNPPLPRRRGRLQLHILSEQRPFREHAWVCAERRGKEVLPNLQAVQSVPPHPPPPLLPIPRYIGVQPKDGLCPLKHTLGDFCPEPSWSVSHLTQPLEATERHYRHEISVKPLLVSPSLFFGRAHTEAMKKSV